MCPAGSAAPRDLLDAAVGGDEEAFRRLVEPHRSELHAHSYRMLGSVHDAEDALQDTLLRAWRGLAGFEDGTRLRPWLYKIATNVCLTAIARRPKRTLPTDHVRPGDPDDQSDESSSMPIWVEPYPDERLGMEDGYADPEARYAQRESVELAFIAALQQLSGRQRAVVILRDVLAFSAREVAESLDTTVASVNSALQRARKTLGERLPDQSQQATLRSLGDQRVRELVERFIAAFDARDVEAIVAMMTEDATFAMPPYSSWRRGRDAIADSWLVPTGPPGRLRYLPTTASGQLAMAAYASDAQTGTWLPLALDVLTLRGAEITGVTAFRTPEIFAVLGLPAELGDPHESDTP